MLGKVKWFSAKKGMGFVTADDGGKDVFVHISVVKEAGMADLVEGQRISMRVAESAKGGKRFPSKQPIDLYRRPIPF